MNYQEDMNLTYRFFCKNTPEIINPNLDKEKPHVEQLVSCNCMKSYRVFVNGNTPISDIEMEGVFCPNCGAPAKDCWMVSGHSAGIFNASMMRQL